MTRLQGRIIEVLAIAGIHWVPGERPDVPLRRKRFSMKPRTRVFITRGASCFSGRLAGTPISRISLPLRGGDDPASTEIFDTQPTISEQQSPGGSAVPHIALAPVGLDPATEGRISYLWLSSLTNARPGCSSRGSHSEMDRRRGHAVFPPRAFAWLLYRNGVSDPRPAGLNRALLTRR